MAAQGGTTSRLGQMQMRFQAKIQKEQDQKRIELNSPSSSSNGSGGGGKVRQLFEERRRGIGIDKSYPLQPINSATMTTTTTTTSSTRSSHGGTPLGRRSTMDRNGNGSSFSGRPSLLGQQQKSTQPFSSGTTTTTRSFTRPLPGRVGGGVTSTTTTTTSVARNNNNNSNATSNLSSPLSTKYDTNNNFDAPDFGDQQQHQQQPMSRYGGGLNGKLAGLSISNEINNNGNGSIRLKPVNLSASSSTSTRSSAGNGSGPAAGVVTAAKRTQVTTTTTRSNGDSPTYSSSSRASPVVGSPSPAAAAAARSPVKKAVEQPQKATTPVRKPSGPPPENMAGCRLCGRYFNKDRIEKHETICEKSKTKKRKVFDTTKHRVKGTDAESYINKKGRTGAGGGQRTVAGIVVKADAKKGNWRKKHEEFIAAIRAAKEMQAHVARGGKLSDLPPPPPSENADYIQCPHCSRRFNEAAATRHIPKCATMLHNKPKPTPVKRRF